MKFVQGSKSGKVSLFAIAGICAALSLGGCASGVKPSAKQAAPDAMKNSIGMTMVHIPAGQFTMGSRPNDGRREMDEVVHPVALTSSFYMAETEVTRAQFSAFVRDTGYRTDAERAGDMLTWRRTDSKQATDAPVTYITWNDAKAFCEWLSAKEGKCYRLPTEAEWEYAARAGSPAPFTTGHAINTRQANFNANECPEASERDRYRGKPVAVAQFAPNGFGLYDMSGNVWEWCSDWYGSYPVGEIELPNIAAADQQDAMKKQMVSVSDESGAGVEAAEFVMPMSIPTEWNTLDPQGPMTGEVKIARGGSWVNAPEYCRSAYRYGGKPESCSSSVGFRCVMEMPKPEPKPKH